MIKKILYSFLIFFLCSTIHANQKNISFSCKGISSFELVGASGEKKESKNLTYTFINGALQDLNNIDCGFDSSQITCESTFLNFRKLTIDLKTKKATDFISGNKGFGQYIESFEGTCKKI